MRDSRVRRGATRRQPDRHRDIEHHYCSHDRHHHHDNGRDRHHGAGDSRASPGQRLDSHHGHHDSDRSTADRRTNRPADRSAHLEPTDNIGPGPDAVAQLQSELVGIWQGPATVPAGWSEIGDVTIQFNADGTYTAASVSADSPAFYYGITCTCASNTYRIVNLNSDGTAELDIDISWDGENHTTRGLVHRLKISGDTLTFEFFRTWGGTYGPIGYELTRAAP